MKPLKFPFKWEERRPLLHEGILFIPQHYDAHTKWPVLFKAPLFVEYGSGNGDWIIQKALEQPEAEWIAVEKRFDRVRKIWSKRERHGLKNLLIVCGEAEIFSQFYLPEHSVDGFYINFPDPWPKLKHAQNRLIQRPFLTRMAELAKPGAFFVLATDDEPYAKQVIQETLDHEAWKSSLPQPFYKQEWENYGYSWFEKLWKEKGKSLFYMQFTKVLADVTLPAGPKSDLDWEEIKKEARTLASAGYKLVWYLDLGQFRLGETAFFNAALFAVDEFTKQIWSQFQSSTHALLLFKGDFHLQLELTEDLEKHEEDFLPHLPNTVRRPLFEMQLLSEWLHRLAAALPEELLVSCRFDTARELNRAKIVQFLSARRFPYIQVERPVSKKSSRAVVLPLDEKIDEEAWQRLNKIFKTLDKKGRSYTVIPEELLNDYWEGVDELIVLPELCSEWGWRLLRGFEATGGHVSFFELESNVEA